MPTDLTGTPTSLGIGTYNVDVDAPSGLGFNAAMAQIDALIAARVTKPAGIASGEAAVWNGTGWDRSSVTQLGNASLAAGISPSKIGGGYAPNKITVSAISGGPPASPGDGDIWVATGVDTNGTRWSFQYNAGSASAYKWEFIGGPATRAGEGGGSITSTTYVDLPTAVSLTVARGGDYIVRFGGHIYNSGATTGVFISLSVGGGAAADGNAAAIENPAINNAVSVAKEYAALGVAASAVVKLQGRVVSGTGQFAQSYLFVQPVRVS